MGCDERSRPGGAIVALGFLAGVLAAASASAGEPSAAEIVARNATARGGVDAWRRIETMRWSGRIESAQAPASGIRFELDQKRPNRTRLEIEAAGGRSVRVFDGTLGWKQRNAAGRSDVQPYSAQELRYAKGGHGIDGPLIDQATRSGPVTLVGVDEIGDRKAYHLRVRAAKGGEEDVWVDTETYLDVRHDRMAEGGTGGRRRVSVTFGDYRTVDGLQVPFLVTTGGGAGATPDRMQIEQVLLNPPLDDARFGSPDNGGRVRRVHARGAPGAPSSTATRSAPSPAAAEGGAGP